MKGQYQIMERSVTREWHIWASTKVNLHFHWKVHVVVFEIILTGEYVNEYFTWWKRMDCLYGQAQFTITSVHKTSYIVQTPGSNKLTDVLAHIALHLLHHKVMYPESWSLKSETWSTSLNRWSSFLLSPCMNTLCRIYCNLLIGEKRVADMPSQV